MNKTSQAVAERMPEFIGELDKLFSHFGRKDANSLKTLRGILEKYQKMEKTLEEIKRETCNRECCLCCADTYEKAEKATSFDPLSQ